MALRDQPYLPLYVQDFLTDEKLAYCSAAATGVYIRIMCLMHKSEHYGKILLKQKFKQNVKHVKNFACQLAYQLPYDLIEIENALSELIAEKVIIIEDDFLVQKRMVKDCDISEKRSLSGSIGGKKTSEKKIKGQKSKKNNNDFAKKFAKAKTQANTEYEYENNIINKEDNILNIKKDEIEKNENKKTPQELEFDRFNKWIDENAPYIRKIKNQITISEYFRLAGKYSGEQIRHILLSIANYKESPKKYTSVNLTFQNWAKREYNE